VIALAGYDGNNALVVAAREALDALIQKTEVATLNTEVEA
jgi:hypothetical protein